MKLKMKGLVPVLACFPWLGIFFILAACSPKPNEEDLSRYVRARSLYAGGRFEEAAAMLSGLENFPPALVLRGKAEYFAGEDEKAEAFFRQAVKRNPSAFEARLYLAWILRARGDYPEAEKIAEALLADNPQDIRTLRLSSSLAGERGKTEEAVAFLDEAAELSAEGALVLLDRARLRWIAGRGGEALEDLSRARAMLPPDTPLLRSIEHLETAVKEAMR
jgi:tetratricopeptide (TPR) repeat protein